jgi:hypothetical protein
MFEGGILKAGVPEELGRRNTSCLGQNFELRKRKLNLRE